MVTTPWYGQRGEFGADPFTYDPSEELRGKVAYYFANRLQEAVDKIYDIHEGDALVRGIHKWLREAQGVPTLPSGPFYFDFQNVVYKLDAKGCIRAIEVLMNFFANLYQNSRSTWTGEGEWVDRMDAMISTINLMFRNYMCGYQAEVSSGDPMIQMIRTDSEFLHAETVRRPLALLREAEMSAAAQQFEEAVKEWSDENYADAITDANSAFESVMKFILKRDSGTASQLIKQLSKRGYLPPYLQSGASQLTDLMEMIPRLRDAKGDVHGRLKQEQLPNYARLAINVAGSLIVFVVEEWKRKGQQLEKD